MKIQIVVIFIFIKVGDVIGNKVGIFCYVDVVVDIVVDVDIGVQIVIEDVVWDYKLVSYDVVGKIVVCSFVFEVSCK